ncbi:MAG: helix-turn-helix transcriptional regulator [Ruminococcaceae bacterium]|nr:helix-turn-helix transcriptional regulator [Oscillospiraceae bacterium]
MSVKNFEIAQRMKEIRELSGYSMVDLAKAMQMEPSEYAEYESGKLSIPVSLLYDVCNVLEISMTELLTGEKAKLHNYSVVRKNNGLEVERTAGYKYQNLAHSFNGRKIEPLLVTVEPVPDGEPMHLNDHNGQEYHYCVEGRMLVRIGEHEVIINEGDSLYFNSALPHGMKALDNKPSKLLVIVI